MTAAMEELIRKLGQATGGSRELDADIYEVALRATVKRASTYLASGRVARTMRRFTTSLDDALTLVPKGFAWNAGDCKHSGAWGWVALDDGGEEVADDPHEADAATPALALCIAALKARSAP